MLMPSAEELYDRHAPMLYGMALRLADGQCAVEAFGDAFIELWGTPAKRTATYTTTRMLQVVIAKVRHHCMQGGTLPEFERRITALAAEMRAGAGRSPSMDLEPRPLYDPSIQQQDHEHARQEHNTRAN